MLAAALFATVAPALMVTQLSDEGVTVLGAVRVSHGEIPHRDFFSFITPLSYFLLAPFLKIFGETLLVVRAVGAAVGLLLLFLTWTVARRLIPHQGFAALPLAFLGLAGTGAWPFPSHHWVSDCLVAAAVLSGLLALETGGRRSAWAAASGALAAASAWALQDQGGVFLLLAPLLWAGLAPRGSRRALLLGFSLGALVVGLLPMAALAVVAGPARIWADLVRYPLEVYWTIPGNRLGVLQPLGEVIRPWAGGAFRHSPASTLAGTLAALALYGLPFVSLGSAALLWRRRVLWGPGVGLLIAGALAFSICAARRWATLNLMWGAALPAVLLALLLFRWWAGASRGRRWIPAAVACTLGGASLFVGVTKGAVALTPARRHAVTTPAGTLYETDPRKALSLQALVDAVGREVPPGAPLLCREMPLVNFLVRRPNPCADPTPAATTSSIPPM